jgi:3-methyl-2-oxobutanoate hydroxymethyltransferase
MATAYDYATARAIDAAGIELALVGDSAATTALGLQATREVTAEELLVLTRAVRRGLEHAVLIGDLPYGTYESSNEDALMTARRFMDVGCDAVKLEGGGEMAERAAAVVAAGIPVMGHVGLTPQVLKPGEPGRVEARTAEKALRLRDDALALERAGCFALVFEAVPSAVSAHIVPLLGIPVIGIGAGPATDGQVLVTYDLLGLTDGHVPKFAKRYADVRAVMVDALSRFAADVRAREFPDRAHEYGMSDAEQSELERRLAQS